MRSSRNEFKTLLSPFALHSPEVFAAIAATSFHRLAYHGNEEFAIKAERYKSAAISGLLKSAQTVYGMPDSNQRQLVAIAVIVMMLYDDMISAQNYFRIIIPILKTLFKLVDFDSLRADSLGEFLIEQLEL